MMGHGNVYLQVHVQGNINSAPEPHRQNSAEKGGAMFAQPHWIWDIQSMDGKTLLHSVTIGRPGPFQVINTPAITAPQDNPNEPPRRRYECCNYETCLALAAALNWDSFTCRGCTGEVNETLYWRAAHEIKRDRAVKKICELPPLKNAIVGHEKAE